MQRHDWTVAVANSSYFAALGRYHFLIIKYFFFGIFVFAHLRSALRSLMVWVLDFWKTGL